MAHLVPLKVKIGLRNANKRLEANHPDFNALVVVQRSGMDWCHYIKKFGDGWHYDKCCGHAVEAPGSPRGMQWGYLLVDETFAIEALAAFGPSGNLDAGIVEEINEATFEAAYDGHCHAHEEHEHIDVEMLQGIKARVDLEVAGIAPPPSPEILALRKRRLDPKDPLPGIRENPARYWSRWKAKSGYTILPRLAKP